MNAHEQPKSERDQQADRLKDVAVLNEEDLTFGLPNQLFYGGLAATGMLCFLLPIVIGLLFGFVYFVSMFQIHKDDPRALELWRRAFRAPTHKSAGSYRQRRMRRL